MKVSVILTSYNHEAYIGESIESILQQTFEDFELLIYDDGSSDHSMDVIASYSDPRIRVIANPFNRGTGIIEYVVKNYAKGELVAVAHSDDYWEKDKLEKQVRYLAEHAEVAAVFTHVHVVGEDGTSYTDADGFYHHIFEQKNRSRYAWLRTFFYEGNCLCHPSVLIRRSAYEEFDMFPTALRQIPDFYMWIRLCLNREIYILEEKLSDFRVRRSERNTSAFRKDTSIRSSIEVHLILDQFLNLQDYDSFLRVFPEAKQFADPHSFIVRYAFARVCLLDDAPNYKKAYGLQLLYGLLQDEEQRAILEKTYQFGIRDFFALTGRSDVYGLYPNAYENCCSLYYDTGEGYSDQNRCFVSYELWMNPQTVQLCFQSPVPKGVCVKKLRMDPIEGEFVRCRLLEVKVNGREAVCTPLNALESRADGECFLTTDPNYEICTEAAEMETVELSFELERIPMQQVSRKMEEERVERRKELDHLNASVFQLQKEVEFRGRWFWRLRRRFGRNDPC